ncbi:MAG: CDP-alcohol phosphatidyltransferase family protein [Actinobacteria bacterium]|nr:CDP-alcohol phosphatidyltransferase family protein [Actinomycetota bacterium]
MMTNDGGGSKGNTSVFAVFTIPNLLTILRACGIPLFLWALFTEDGARDLLAIAILAIAGFTDYLDGRLARALNQSSQLGELLDPLVDRLYIAAVLIGLAIRGVIPLWILALLIARDLILATTLPGLYRIGKGPLPVTFLGKAATLNLLYAFPLLLLGEQEGFLGQWASIFAVAFSGWGLLLYLLTGIQYFFEARSQIREGGSTVAT